MSVLTSAANRDAKDSDAGSRADGKSPSIVLLLRESRVTSLEDLRRACERSFGVPFSGEIPDRFCVVQKTLFTIVKAGPHTLSFMHYAAIYGDKNSLEIENSFSLSSQKEAWRQHAAWEAINYVKSRGDLNLEHAILARICAQLLDENCTGAWIPMGPMMIPNDGSLMKYLKHLGSSCPVPLE